MKKLLPALVFLLILGAGAGAVYLFEKPRRGAAATEVAAEFLPADTEVLLSVPDVDGTISEWKSTDLYKIWQEPEVQAFLVRPLSKLPPHGQVTDVLAQIGQLSPSNVFLALAAVDAKSNALHAVAGFDFQGDKSEVEKLLAGARDAVRQQSPGGKADLIEYQGHALETFDDGGGNVVASTYLPHRYLVANDVALLKSVLDRCDHRPPSSGVANALESDADFQAVLAKLPTRHATLAFARPKTAMRRVFDLMAASGQSVDDAKRAEFDKIRAIGATTTIENGKLRDTLYCLAPGMNLDLARLRLGSQALAAPSTLLYAAAMCDLPARLNLPTGPPPPGTPASGLLTSLSEFAKMLEDHGLTLERVRQAFGNEISLQLDWPDNRTYPSLLATIDVRDGQAAGKFVDDLTNTLMAEGAWQVSHPDGLTLHTWSSASFDYVTPALTLTDKELIFGLDAQDVIRAVQQGKTGKANFTSADAYKTAVGMVTAPNAAFVYLDSAALFERVYGAVRGFAMFGAALLYPQLGENVDLAKLPSAESITRHLSPTVFSQHTDAEGSLVESVGSFTLGEAAFVAVGGASAAAFPLIQSQLGAQAGGSSVIPPARAATPTGTPDPVTPQPH